MRRLLLAAAVAGLAAPVSAARAAGEPIMPLRDVRPGMDCTVRSVVHGTEISTFAARVLDVVDADPAGEEARILVRLSGAAIADGGIGPGFSGSPMSCPGPGGAPRVAGALSEGIGDYGNDVALATPIEQVLAQPVRPPRGVRPRARAPRGARPLAALTLTGLPRALVPLARRAAARAGRTLLAVPGGPAAGRYAPPPLVPGASVAADASTGALSLGAIGTVTYRDGDRLWAFGHPLDDAGLRSLFLQDAYVYGVIGNPVAAGDAQTYKLAAPGHVRGTVSSDGTNAIAGTLGAAPAAIDVVQRVRDLDTGRRLALRSAVADETDLGNPDGTSPLTVVAGLGTAVVGTRVLSGSPADQSGRLCLRLRLRERRAPLGFCNRYAARGLGGADTPGAVGLAAADDVAAAVAIVESTEFAALHVRDVRVDLGVERGLRLVRLVSASAPRRVRPGRRIRVRAVLRRVRGETLRRSFLVRVPRGLRPGRRSLVLTGAAPSSSDLESALANAFDGGGSPSGAAEPPRTLSEVAAAVARLARYDGVRARFGRAPAARAYRDPRELVTGRLRLRVRVVR